MERVANGNGELKPVNTCTTAPDIRLAAYSSHRWFEPQRGRYTRTDREGIFGGPHPYSYALPNPLVSTDPLGLRTMGFGGSFWVDPACSCDPGPVGLKDEDSDTQVPLPAAGGRTDADAVYTPDGMIKIPDFGSCFLRCDSDGKAQYISCAPLPPVKHFSCGEPLPAGWPSNPYCS